MALRDIFKKKKTLPEKKEVEKPVEKVKEIKKETPKVLKRARTMLKKGIAYRILKGPHITEKATALSKKNQYVFKVYSRANKIEIKKAVEQLYNVKVLTVKIIRVPRKKRRLGRITGWRKAYKKAIVMVKQGEKIEIAPR